MARSRMEGGLPAQGSCLSRASACIASRPGSPNTNQNLIWFRSPRSSALEVCSGSMQDHEEHQGAGVRIMRLEGRSHGVGERQGHAC